MIKIRYQILFSLLLLSFFSCEKVNEMQKTAKGDIVIDPEGAGISEPLIVKWRVGPQRDQLVSMGIRVKLELPVLNDKDLKELIDVWGLDSWLIRYRRRTLASVDLIGQYYVPIIIKQKSASKYKVNQIKEGLVKIFYSAAAISGRFQTFACPQFKHNKLITETSEKMISGSRMTIASTHFKKLLEEINIMTFTPDTLNGGINLFGEYYVEIAAYDSNSKKILSSFATLEKTVKIDKEEVVELTGCDNYKIPDESYGDEEKLRQFKFGR